VTTSIKKAFILGAGLGTRLRPLTEQVPKPLVPLWNRPLITFAFDHLLADLDVESFLVNTHHCPEVYSETFPVGEYSGCPLEFRYETTLLDTAGGIDNIRDWLPTGVESFVVYNGDILTNLPMAEAAAVHQKSGNLVTLVLRSEGQGANVSFDRESGHVLDLRNLLETNTKEKFQFTGIYFVRPEFVERFVKRGKIESVVHSYIDCISECDGVGGVIIDDGTWLDLGNRESYLEASADHFGEWAGETRIHSDAVIDSSAEIDSISVIGAGAQVGAGSKIERSILWDGAIAEAGAVLKNCIVRTGETARGILSDTDC